MIYTVEGLARTGSQHSPSWFIILMTVTISESKI